MLSRDASLEDGPFKSRFTVREIGVSVISGGGHWSLHSSFQPPYPPCSRAGIPTYSHLFHREKASYFAHMISVSGSALSDLPRFLRPPAPVHGFVRTAPTIEELQMMRPTRMLPALLMVLSPMWTTPSSAQDRHELLLEPQKHPLGLLRREHRTGRQDPDRATQSTSSRCSRGGWSGSPWQERIAASFQRRWSRSRTP